MLGAYGVLRTRGPLCGDAVAKKLVNGKGIWELIGNEGNLKGRLLFYFDETNPGLIVFVLGFMKTGGKKDYRRFIETAQSRRQLIQRGDRISNVIATFDTTTRH
jgi:hypothetical protein